MLVAIRSYVAVLLAAAVTGAGGLLVQSSGPIDAAPLILLGVVAGAAAVIPVRFIHAGQTQGFTLESGVVAALLLSGFAWVTPALMLVMSFLVHAVRSRNPNKTLFNAARSGLETTLAASVFLALAAQPAGPSDGRAIAAVLAAIIVFEVTSLLLTTELMARLGETSRRETLHDVRGLWGVNILGNLAYGIVLATAVDVELWIGALAGLMMLVMYLGYRGYAAAVSGERRAQALNRMTRALIDLPGGQGTGDGVGDLLKQLIEVFGGDHARMIVEGEGRATEWRVTDDGVKRSGLASSPRSGILATAIARGHGIVEADPDADQRETIAAPIVRHGKPVGAVAISGRRGVEPWSEADASLLASVANEVAVALDNVALLNQIEEERARLEAESTKLNNILGAATDGISSFLADGTIEAWNPGMARITGVTAEAAVGQPWHAVLRLKDGAGIDLAPTGDHMVARALDGDFSAEPLSLQVLRADGVWRLLQCTASPVREPDGQRRGVVVVARDVTTERELEELKADFISTVSHELRTPLTPLKGFLATLRNPRTALTQDQLESIHGSMSTQLTRLETLISDLLAVAELDHGQFNLYPEPLVLGELLPEAVELEAADQFSRCTVTVDPDARAVADSVALVRVVRSLVSNAVKHTEGRVEVTARAVGERVEIAVADEGPGIASWDQQRVFNRFERLGNHLRRTQGPGLGLTIARTLAQRMGGDVSVASDIGQGALFTLSLPRARPRALDAPPAVPTLDQVDEATS